MFNLESEQDNQAQRPMDLRYMKLLRIILSQVFSWPRHLFGEDYKAPIFRNTVTIFCEGAFVCFGGLIYAKTNFKEISFLEMGKTYLTIELSVVSAQRVTMSWFNSYHKLMKQFLFETHLIYHRHKSEYCEHVYRKVHKLCHIFTVFICTQLFIGILFFNLIPVFNNYMKGMFGGKRPADERFEHSIDFVFPVMDQHRNLKAYTFIAILNILFSYDCGLNFCTFDITLAIIVFHIWGHLKILDNKLQSIPTPELMSGNQSHSRDAIRYTKEENKKVATILKDIINHHRMIKTTMSNTSDAFGLMLCIYYVFHQISGCILLLECSSLDAKSLARYGPLTITIYQYLIQVSVILELLGYQSEKLKDAVFSVPWECMDTSNRKIVLFLLCNVQEPIRLKPLGMVSVGVQTMASILKTSFSYFMLLKTFT